MSTVGACPQCNTAAGRWPPVAGHSGGCPQFNTAAGRWPPVVELLVCLQSFCSVVLSTSAAELPSGIQDQQLSCLCVFRV